MTVHFETLHPAQLYTDVFGVPAPDTPVGRELWPRQPGAFVRQRREPVSPGEATPGATDAEVGPTVELRVQALFGEARHPVIGTERTPLILSLTSPAGRPIQTTRDLPGFWAGSWTDVAKEMRGRYPRHNWPDDPAVAVASLKTKRAQERSGGKNP